MKTHFISALLLSCAACLHVFGSAPQFLTQVLPIFPDGDLVVATIGDVYNDGRNELVVVDSRLDLLRIVRVNSDGTWAVVDELNLADHAPGWEYVSPAIKDMNGDGKNDIVVWHRSNNAKGHVLVLTRSGSGFIQK